MYKGGTSRFGTYPHPLRKTFLDGTRGALTGRSSELLAAEQPPND